ncbi:hypothetical protein ACFVT5_04290 [Streptomyces sp. NPDC058001]|uniref:hypothetical protein n=1 Tax=Streptomyces sp. NPDC058001 TaxID=3346300 RepID=UPI0036E41419
MSTLAPHPFPARMAPELALRALECQPAGSVVLDPMCGSGTVLRTALIAGHQAIGVDMDPLAVLMARVWTSHRSATGLAQAAHEIVNEAAGLQAEDIHLPWIDDDPETKKFIKFWFAESQLSDLRKISFLIERHSGQLKDSLQLSLSRIVITKKRGASLAHDVSHSRPHRVGTINDFDVLGGFRKAATQIEHRLLAELPNEASVRLGDARGMPFMQSGSVDLVVTSPPYLNAIDYLRGHRMALVWLGHSVGGLRDIRGTSVGAERGLKGDDALEDLVVDTDVDSLPQRTLGILYRYAQDMKDVAAELHRVLKPSSPAVLVVGNSTVRGTFVDNASVVRRASEQLGFVTQDISERDLPSNRRYLPPPTSAGEALDQRMRKEVVLTIRK